MARSFITILSYTFFILVGLIFIFDFSELQRKTSSVKNIPLTVKWKMIFMKMPFLLESLLPFIFFSAALAFFWRLNRYGEAVILRTCGLSIWKMIFPVLAVAFFLGGMDLGLFNPGSVTLFKAYQQHQMLYLNRGPVEKKPTFFAIPETGLWLKKNDATQQIIYHFQGVKPKEDALTDLSIYILDNQNKFLKRYDAAFAQMKKKEMVLHNVWALSQTGASSYHSNLALPFSLDLHYIANHSPDPQLLSLKDWPDLKKLLAEAGVSLNRYSLHIQNLWARSFWLGAMVLLAAAFSFLATSKRNGIYYLGGVALCFLLYFLRDVTYAMGNSGKIPIFFAAWTPPLLTGFLAVMLLLYQEEGA